MQGIEFVLIVRVSEEERSGQGMDVFQVMQKSCFCEF